MANEIVRMRDALQKYIVKPANEFGFGGFIFDVEDSSSVTLTSDITDHYVENNSSVSDHIAISPKKVTLKNYVGEVADFFDDSIKGQAQRVVQKLTVLSQIAAPVTTQAQQVYDAISSGEIGNLDFDSTNLPSASDALDLYTQVKNLLPPFKKQELAYQYFKAVQQQRILLSIQTPFEFMTNMAIESMTATQERDSRFVMSFSVTFKEIRTATTEIRQISSQGRRARQAAATANLGNTNGKTATTERRSQLYGLFGDQFSAAIGVGQ